MFVASDVISEESGEDGASHRVERRCALDVDAPRLLKRVSGLCAVAALPSSVPVCDPSVTRACAGSADRRGGLRVLHPEKLPGPEREDASHRVP